MLQAYALMQHLKKMGHTPELLFVQSVELDTIGKIKYILKKHLFSHFVFKWKFLRYEESIEKNTRYFVEHYISPKTEPLWKEEHFKKITSNDYNAYIVGSDQVWRARAYRYIQYAFFGFVEDNKPLFLSYAASFGVDKWEYTIEETIRYKTQLQRFSGVSVREESGVALCKEYFDKDAVWVLDPTMLLEINDYLQMVENENEPKREAGILTYILDDTNETQKLTEEVSKILNLPLFSVNVKSKHQNSTIKDITYPTVTSWLRGFFDASYVVTDSFHGCVFAILFNKPFVVYGNQKRGMARFNSILKLFELEERLITSTETFENKIIHSPINWERVNTILQQQRVHSMNYLSNTLNSI